LAAGSVDYIVAGQAFHWFEPAASKREMQRILRPGGHVTLLWNQRDTGSAFQAAYEQLLDEYGTDFKQVDQQRVITPEVISAFFAPQLVLKFTLPNAQRFDLEGLRGRLLSSSYTPRLGDANYEPMLAVLGELFAAHQQAGFVDFTYTTSIYIGTLP
jgi:SAM-dependent methyltransferase